MLAIALVSVMFVAPTEPSPQDQAKIYAAAAEAHLERAVPGDQQLDELDGAHKNFDLAYLTTDDTRHLCRALQVAELALATVTFTDPQARLSWEEVQRDDLEGPRKQAATTERANCRHDAQGQAQQPRVAVLTDADFPPPAAPRASSPADSGQRAAGDRPARTDADAEPAMEGPECRGSHFYWRGRRPRRCPGWRHRPTSSIRRGATRHRE